MPSLSEKEAGLLMEINQGLPRAAQQRLYELIGKRQDEAISDVERKELKQLVDKVEKLDGKIETSDRTPCSAWDLGAQIDQGFGTQTRSPWLRGGCRPVTLQQLKLSFVEASFKCYTVVRSNLGEQEHHSF